MDEKDLKSSNNVSAEDLGADFHKAQGQTDESQGDQQEQTARKEQDQH